ncbi:glycosyltransferase [Alicyclobacillus fodiniaquatilis]|uniref:Glycosyltransferase n=1 Tax=Alicyclobacillus fodiniaquatilis TaxID=1661150 RepID=A0ABW4JL94_9BACL
MFASIIVPSYQRAKYLSDCLASILNQQTCNDLDYEVLVVIRRGDKDTELVVSQFLNQRLVPVYVNHPGVLEAMKVGVSASKGDIVLFIDDDAEAPSNWISAHCSYYINDTDSIACVAGRDILDAQIPIQRFSFGRVGIVTGYGRLIGDHCQAGKARQEIDVPKGVNMSVRRRFIELPNQLSGSGAQIHWEVYLGLALTSRGKKVIYDPNVIVHHHSAPRPVGDDRKDLSLEAVFDAAYNFSYAFAKFRPWNQCFPAVVYWSLCGDAAAPGVLRCITRWGLKQSWVCWYIAMKGRFLGLINGRRENVHA